MDWDDLRYVLAISRAGGLNGAARALDVNPSSVYRRLEALEKALEVRLFERLRAGGGATPYKMNFTSAIGGTLELARTGAMSIPVVLGVVVAAVW